MCVPNSPLFQRCQVYDWPPFFNKKYMNDPIFLDSYVKGPIFLISWYMHIFFVQRFFEAAYLLGITWINYDICVINSKTWVQKIKGQYMNRSTFWGIKYMNGSVFSKARYMNGVGFEILARTPIPKLPLSYPPPPPPPRDSVITNSVDPDQLASEEANWSGSALFVIKYVNFYQKPGSSNLIGWKSEVGVAFNLFSMTRVNNDFIPFANNYVQQALGIPLLL